MLNSYRGPSFGGSSKATASTLCQKCLKRGHYSYECKAITQERPYVSRPSRTQQLFNPKLVPKLTSDVPQELLRKRGIADEQLNKRERERSQRNDIQNDDLETHLVAKRTRSASSTSSASVATISTNVSRSPSRDRAVQHNEDSRDTAEVRRTRTSAKRSRASFSSMGSTSSDTQRERARMLGENTTRETRRRISEASPPVRGRRRSRTPPGRRSWHSGKESISPGIKRPDRNHKQEKERDDDRVSTTFDRDSPNRLDSHRLPSNSQDLSPMSRRRTEDPNLNGDNGGRRQHDEVHGRHGKRELGGESSTRLNRRKAQADIIPQKERSLSPFSKRLALTQSMNTAR